MASVEISYTKAALEGIKPPVSGRDYYKDKKVNGLRLQVTPSGIKSFQVRRKLEGKLVTVTLGRFPDLSIENARKLAYDKLGEIASGINPNSVKKASKSSSVTLSNVFSSYIDTRTLEPTTLKDYNRHLNDSFKDWKDRRFDSITQDLVKERHRRLSIRSKARANGAMRVLRALFNYAAVEYKNEEGRSLFPENPTRILTAHKAWNRVSRKKTYIKQNELKRWYDYVIDLPSQCKVNSQAGAIREICLIWLFVGLRPTEGLSLRVENVDMENRIIHIPKEGAKNHESIELPMPQFIAERLTTWASKQGTATGFMFPANSATGYLTEPKDLIKKIREATDIYFTPHDLRRTFATIAESLDIYGITLKRLLNHKIDDADVTAGYVVTDVERLRGPSNRVEQRILELVKPEETDSKVVQLKASG